MLNKEIPFLRIGLPLCFGIVSGLYFKPGTAFLVSSLVLIITGFCISLFFNKFLINVIYGISLSFALFICGIVLYSNEKNSLTDLDPSPAGYLCVVSSYPEDKGKTLRMTAKIKSRVNENGITSVNGSLLIYLRKDSSGSDFLPGDIFRIQCTPVRIANRGNPDEFDYRFHMENQGIKFYAFADRTAITDHIKPRHRKLIHRALIIREKIIDMYRARGITGDQLALVAAITLGQKNLLDPEQKQSFMKAGVMHIMAVSGLHAVIISLFVFNLLFFLKGRFEVLRIILTVISLWIFAFVTGLAPSVLRATLMFSFLQTGKLLHRNVNNINSVLASAFILLLIRPSVLFDAGFLLSYSAVIFIICFYQDLYLKLDFKNWLKDKVWQSAAVTITAQAGTLSLTISLFNRFPTYFIITNIIIVPLSSLLIILGCLVLVTFPLAFISGPLAFLLNFLTGVTEILTKRISSLPFSTIENIGMGTLESVLLSILIFLLMLFLMNRKSVQVHYLLVSIFLFTLSCTFRDINNKSSGELIVYSTPGYAAIGIREGQCLNLFTDTTVIMPEIKRHCASRHLKVKMVLINEKFKNLVVEKKKILICSFLNSSLLQESEPDIIILSGEYPEIDRHLKFDKPLNSVIITSEVKNPDNCIRIFKGKTIKAVYSVKKSGAYRLKL